MKRGICHPKVSIWMLLLLAGMSIAPVARADTKALRGKIVTCSKELKIPASAKHFVKKILKQDRHQFKKDSAGRWVIHFVAFFNRKLPIEQIGVVVLDAKDEPVAVANVVGKKGQTTLASQILVESTETPGKQHTLQVYFAKQGKPIVLAKKQVVLK